MGLRAGEFPDNVSSFKILSPTKFSLTFTGTYQSAWLYNELGQLIPIPQYAWDKESAAGSGGQLRSHHGRGEEGLQFPRGAEQGPVHLRHEPALAGRRRPVEADQLRRLDRRRQLRP